MTKNCQLAFRCVTHGILLESTQRYTKCSANSAVGPGTYAKKNKKKSVVISASVHIHNAKTKRTHHKSMVKLVYLEREMAAPHGQLIAL